MDFKKIFLIINLIASLFTFSAWSAPYLESPIKNFLNESHLASSKKIKTLLTFNKELRVSSSQKQHLSTFQSSFDWMKNKKIENFWLVSGIGVSLSAAEIKKLASHPSLKGIYWLDRPVKIETSEVIPLDPIQDTIQPPIQSVPLRYTYGLEKIGVPQLRQAYPHIQGTGVRVGVIDTGIKADHPDLSERVKKYKNFSPAENEEPADGFNHGTHVAGTIAGGNKSGKFIGVAPEADLIIARIFASSGESTTELILKSIQWMADPDGNPRTKDHAHIVNGSWSSSESYADENAADNIYCNAITNLKNLGIIPVFSSGNSGPEEGSVNMPGACPDAFSVGATDGNDRSMRFSGVGPAKWKDVVLPKPEVVAPGFEIESAGAGWDQYIKLSGTSMSTPHVSGAFALLKQAFPKATPAELKSALTKTSRDLGVEGHDKDFGWGRIDVYKAAKFLEKK